MFTPDFIITAAGSEPSFDRLGDNQMYQVPQALTIHRCVGEVLHRTPT